MFQDALECYQAIGSALAGAAQRPWDHIVLKADLGGDRIDTVIACWRDGDDSPSDYLAGVPRLASHIYDLARLTSNPEKGLLKSCVIVLKKNGTYNVDFVY